VAVGDMTVPASTTLAFNMATGATLTIFGTIKFAYAKSKGPQVLISGQNVKVGGNGVIDGGGQQYWANKKDDGTKPDCLWLHDLHNSEVRDITIKNTPIQAVSILARYLNIINVKVDNSAGEQFGAQNTDAFDIGRSEHINIIGGKITTQDDAVVVNDGKHISITGVVAQGTHGFSISVSRGTVENVTVHDCTVNGGMYGVRLKTSKFGGAGSVKGVLWQNNRFHDIKVAAVAILQNYYDGRASGTPGNGVTI
ncbi:glycoside hydrolase, partial [Protomyces lactucae-debilis]